MNDGTFTIRGARAGDRDDLARLSAILGYPMTAEAARARLGEIADHPDHALLVAESQGRVVAWLQVSLPRIFESPRQAEIAGLVVDEDARGQGIGSRLLREAEGWARDRHCAVLRVRSNVIRDRAHGFYLNAGFGEIKTQKVFERRIDAARADPPD